MKFQKTATVAALAVLMVAVPASAQTADANDWSDKMAEIANKNMGYVSAALLLAAPAAIGIGYLSGTIRGMIGWGKSKKG